jgi:hypothetical protein
LFFESFEVSATYAGLVFSDLVTWFLEECQDAKRLVRDDDNEDNLEDFLCNLEFSQKSLLSTHILRVPIWCTLFNWSMKSDLLKKDNWG